MQIERVWFGLGATVFFIFSTRGLIRPDLLLKANSERLQTSMSNAGFEPADYGTKWQNPTIRPSPGVNRKGAYCIC